ncbi:MAG: site-2 protease family protein [Actinomycetota bacterium]
MFRLLGFNVHVRPGFIMFMLLIVVLIGGDYGLWLAGSLAAFTLLHELGHALAARRAGAKAEISLNFLAGYASYVPTRPLSRAEQAWISFAGPAIQIVTSVAILLAMGVNPLDRDSFDTSAASLAIWWAGPVIGLFNLLPILPLDGGHIVMNGLDRILPGRAERVVLWVSITITGAAATAVIIFEEYRGFMLVVGFVLVMQLQMLGANRQPTSPWRTAADAVAAGRSGKARRVLVGALTQPNDAGRPSRFDLTADEALAVLDVLPEPYPSGNSWNEYILANVLIAARRYEDAAHYAADSYHRHPHALIAAAVARAAAGLGDRATAVGWMRTAVDERSPASGVASVIDSSPEFAGIRNDPDVVALRRALDLPAPVEG